ncbi:MAG TPA: hypothetical protein VHN39_05105 [Phenylobacterium sp.]|nr:hypothetical protein [Phenylobacterium sp.]
MSSRMTNSRRALVDHFEPDDLTDPKAQKQLRGQLEQIDYTAYAANKEVLAAVIGRADALKFAHLGLATAQARARWAALALAATEGGRAPSAQQIEEIARLRMAFEELSEVYDALRRMVERGYLSYAATDVTARAPGG